MSARPNYFRLGLFMLAALAAFVAALLIFGSGKLFRPHVMLETYVNGTVQGIEVGTPVKFRGVQIGEVHAIDFTFNVYNTEKLSDDYNYIIIYMNIDKEISPHMFKSDLTPMLQKNIANGMRIRIQPLGITGMNYLDIDFVDATRFPPLPLDWQPTCYYIPYAPGELTNLLDSVTSIMHSLEKIDLDNFNKTGLALLNNINKSVVDANIGKVSTDLQNLTARIDNTIQAANIPQLSADGRRLIDQLDASNRDLQKILKNLEPATRLNSDQIKAILNNLNNTSANLHQFSAEVARRPSLILWGTPPPKPSPTAKPAHAPSLLR